jgi:hypothetical protein
MVSVLKEGNGREAHDTFGTIVEALGWRAYDKPNFSRLPFKITNLHASNTYTIIALHHSLTIGLERATCEEKGLYIHVRRFRYQ